MDVRGKRRPAEVRSKPLYIEGDVSVGRASYPDDLKYHPEHDWARIDGDTATFGITWYAQDALGEVVFFDPPEVGAQVSKDQTYAEVESVKAVSDVFAPLSGEIVEVNGELARRAGEDQRRPLRRRAGWSRSSSPTRPRWTRCWTSARTASCSSPMANVVAPL